jgi:exosortase K
MKIKLAIIVATAVIAWGLKRHYAEARADDLWWVLTPTARLAGVITATGFEMQPGEGYFSRERMFLIEKSCAGVNFIIAAFGMVTMALLHRASSPGWALGVVGAGLVAGYASAVMVNAARISIAMWLAAHPLSSTALNAADVHRIEGIVVYFGGLVLLYEVTQRFDRRALGGGAT